MLYSLHTNNDSYENVLNSSVAISSKILHNNIVTGKKCSTLCVHPLFTVLFPYISLKVYIQWSLGPSMRSSGSHGSKSMAALMLVVNHVATRLHSLQGRSMSKDSTSFLSFWYEHKKAKVKKKSKGMNSHFKHLKQPLFPKCFYLKQLGTYLF